MFEVSQDLQFLNPIIRGFNDQIWNDKDEIKDQIKSNISQFCDWVGCGKGKRTDEEKEADRKEKEIERSNNIVILNGRDLIDKFLLNRDSGHRSF